MSDFNNFGGSEEENAEIKRLNTEVVSSLAHFPPAGRILSPVC